MLLQSKFQIFKTGNGTILDRTPNDIITDRKATADEGVKMTKHFHFSPQPGPSLELASDFAVSLVPQEGMHIISNIKTDKAFIYAPEINFYLRNCNCTATLKADNVTRLYQIRAALFDLAQQTRKSIHVGRRILFISSLENSMLKTMLDESGFTVVSTEPESIVLLEGHIGKIHITVQADSELFVIEADQVVWSSCPEKYLRKKGVYDPGITGDKTTCQALQEACGSLSYSKAIKYDSSLCLLHNKSRWICGECTSVCPTGAVNKNKGPQTITISSIDCIGCGACIGACPTGALDSTTMPRNAFSRIRTIFRDRVALILPATMDLENLKLPLHEKILPLVIDSDFQLDECHLLALIQSSGYPVIHYVKHSSEITENIIYLLNSIFGRKFKRNAIEVCRDESVQGQTTEELLPFDDILYDLDERSLPKREIMALRLKNLIGDDDFGTIFTGPHLHYGIVSIDETACTLCLSCAGHCKPGALSVHPEDNTLRFTPALCTCCGNCSFICPEENCLKTIGDQLVLHPLFFQDRVMAQDDIFKCVECGVGFGPVKSINKIAEIMKPKFGADSLRVKTLYCCPDCKAKIMLEKLNMETV